MEKPRETRIEMFLLERGGGPRPEDPHPSNASKRAGLIFHSKAKRMFTTPVLKSTLTPVSGVEKVDVREPRRVQRQRSPQESGG